MDWQSAISDMQYRCQLARANRPTDIVTITAEFLVKGLTTVLGVVLLPLEVLTTGLGGCLIALTFGVLYLLLSLIWLPVLGLLLGTSWLWLRAWYLRPVLLLPGVIIAVVADVFVMLAPEPERDAKHAKLCIAGEWPLSWYLLRPPPAYGMVRCDVCGGEGTYRGTAEPCFACEGSGLITPEMSRRLNEELAAEMEKRGVDRLTGQERLHRITEIVDEMQITRGSPRRDDK